MIKKDCTSGKIFDMITKRCIATNTKMFKDRVTKQLKNGIKRFDPDDLVKLGYITQPVKSTQVSQTHKVKLNNEIKDNLKNKLQKAKDNIKYEYKYVDEDHKKYCKFQNTMIKKPMVYKFISYNLTYMKSPIYGDFSMDMFKDLRKRMWTAAKFDTGIGREGTNLDRMNKLPTDEETENAVDIDWFVKANEYIQQLTDEELFAVKGYTHHGDVLMNKYLRKTLNINVFIKQYNKFFYYSNYFPLFFPFLRMIFKYRSKLDTVVIDKKYQFDGHLKIVLSLFKSDDTSYRRGWGKISKTDEAEDIYTAVLRIVTLLKKSVWEEAIKLLVVTLNDVIHNSPSTTRKMILYRGEKNDDYFKVDTGKKFFKIKGFISTSLSPHNANRFSGSECCMNEITVLPGSKCLFLMGVSSIPEEIEVLLGMNTTYLMRSHRLKSYPHNGNMCSVDRSSTKKTTKLVAL